jgi:cobalt-zinc-cadmium efflux system membrane fusion protein
MENKYYFTGVIAALLIAGCNIPKNSSTSSESPGTPNATSARNQTTGRDELVLSEAEQKAAMIETRPATVSSEPDIIRAKGRIVLADDRMWRVGVRTNGIVVVVYAGLGDYVKKGQVLARYHADEVRDTRALYRAAVSERDRASAVAAQARRNRDRASRLLELKAGSAQQVEVTEQDLATAEAAVRKAEVEIDRTRDVLEDDLRVPVESRPEDPIADDVPILAPESGYVIEKNVTPGKTVELSTDTFVLGDLTKVWMLASIRQEDISNIRTGVAVTVTLPGDQQSRFFGRVTNLGQRFDPATRVLPVRIELNNPAGRLRPEMLANAEIPAGGKKPAITVSSDAVQQVDGQDAVFVRTDADRFSVRPVRTGETAEGRTIIFEGLNPGDQVVVQGSFILKSQLLKSALQSE